jgi:four helix bundle protein
VGWERSKLTLWQRAMDFADLVYDATERWPSHELFGMTSQVRRAVVSVPANVAEGQGRFGNQGVPTPPLDRIQVAQ